MKTIGIIYLNKNKMCNVTFLSDRECYSVKWNQYIQHIFTNVKIKALSLKRSLSVFTPYFEISAVNNPE